MGAAPARSLSPSVTLGHGPGRHLPGLGVVAAGVAVAYGSNLLVPVVSPLMFAIALGVVFANAGLYAPALRPGVTSRVVLLAPMVIGAGIVRRRRARAASGTADAAGAKTTTTLLLCAALFGLGTGVHVRGLVRTGGRALAVGALSMVLIAAISYAGLTLIG